MACFSPFQASKRKLTEEIMGKCLEEYYSLPAFTL